MNVKDHVPDADAGPAQGRPAGWWGMSAAIKVTGCDLQKLRSKRTVRRFMRALVTEIGMKAYGRPTVKRYGTLAALIAAIGIRLPKPMNTGGDPPARNASTSGARRSCWCGGSSRNPQS